VSESSTLKTLSNIPKLAAQLSTKGLSKIEAENKAKNFAGCAKALCESGLADETAAKAFFVPGRIEVLGKHTDYAGGRSIVAAVEKGFCIVAAQREDNIVHILDGAASSKIEFEITEKLSPVIGHWSNYPMTVARRLIRNFPVPLKGADIAFISDLPQAAGLSSSSAMIVGFFLVFSALNDLQSQKQYRSNIHSPEDLAAYLGTVENGQAFGSLGGDKGVGTFGGSEDHTAILCCRAGSLSQYSYCPVRFEQAIDLHPNYIFAIASCGVVAEKTGSAMMKYNRVSQLILAMLDIWNNSTGRKDTNLADVIASDLSASNLLRELLKKSKHERFKSDELIQRFEHFLAENEQIIPAASEALAKGDFERFGHNVHTSQESAEKLLGNQIPETAFLARCANELGAIAASAFGAGFGGSVWALIRKENSEQFPANWSRSYAKEFPASALKAQFLLTQPGPGAFEL